MKNQAKKDKDAYAQRFLDAAVRVRVEAVRRSRELAALEEEKGAKLLALQEQSHASELVRVTAQLEQERALAQDRLEAECRNHTLALQDQKEATEYWREQSLTEKKLLMKAQDATEREAQRADHFTNEWRQEKERADLLKEGKRRVEEQKMLEVARRELLEKERHEADAVGRHLALKPAARRWNPFQGPTSDDRLSDRHDRLLDEAVRAAQRCRVAQMHRQFGGR